MLSRRSIRVKVMQTLYAANRSQLEDSKSVVQAYNSLIDQTHESFVFTIGLLIQVAKCSVEDAEKRKNKYIPTEEDKQFQPTLYKNKAIQAIVNSKSFNVLFEKYQVATRLDNDIANNIYAEFAKGEAYKGYLLGEINDDTIEAILLELFLFCRHNETFIEIIEDNYPSWEDDKSVIVGAAKKIIKSAFDTSEIDPKDYYTDKPTVKEFGETLLKRTFESDTTLLTYIDPLLTNWDSERVAVIDLVFLKLAAVEFLEFESVPTKVTINEYVELAKDYSTPKSKDFINGVLDALLNDLTEKSLITKDKRGSIG